METNSHFESQSGEKSAGKSPLEFLKEKVMGYIVIGLIFVFFSIPFAGLSVQYYKYGVSPRFLGLVHLFMHW